MGGVGGVIVIIEQVSVQIGLNLNCSTETELGKIIFGKDSMADDKALAEESTLDKEMSKICKEVPENHRAQ